MTTDEILDDINRSKREGDIVLSWRTGYFVSQEGVGENVHIALITKEHLEFLKACRDIEAFKK